MNGSAQNMRRVPEAWTATIATAEAALAAHDDLSAASIVHRSVAELDNESLEAARYYGIGEILCHTARSLANPVTREFVVKQGATSFAKTFARPSLTGRTKNSETAITFRHVSLRAKQLAGGLGNVISAAQQSLEPAGYITANALYMQMEKRREIPGRPSAYGQQLDFTDQIAVAHTELAGDTIGDEAMAGTVRALRKIASATHSGNIRQLPVDTLQLRRMDMWPALTQMAAMHITPFLAITTPTSCPTDTFKDKTGKWRVRPEVLRQSKLESNALHDNTLACPALHIAHFIPTVIMLTLDTIEAAQLQLAITESQQT